MSRSDKGVRWCGKRSGFDIANGKSPLAGSGAEPRLNSYERCATKIAILLTTICIAWYLKASYSEREAQYAAWHGQKAPFTR